MKSTNLLIFLISLSIISYNTTKTPETLSKRIVKNVNFFRFSQDIFAKSLSLQYFRRDYFSMSNRTNIRQPGKPVTERHSIEAKGAFYDNEGRQAQKSS
jgi:hypothetical protein